MFNNRNLAEPYRGDWNDEERMIRDGHSYHAQSAPSDPEYIRQLRVGCYGAITHMDHQIGRIISALVEQKLIEELADREEGYSDGMQLIVGRPSQTVLKHVSC